MSSSRSPSRTAATLPISTPCAGPSPSGRAAARSCGSGCPSPPGPACRRRCAAAPARAPPRPCAAIMAFSRPKAFSRFWSWLRSSWELATRPVGSWISRTADDVLFTCWPAGAGGPEDLHADVAVVHLDVGRVDHGPHVDGGEAGLAAGVAVERADAHQAVGAPLGGHQPVGVAALDGELGREDAGLRTLRDVVDLDREAAAARPSGMYIRSSISAQSWASTPPSLALTRQMASASSCSPVNRLRSSSCDSSRVEPRARSTRSPAPGSRRPPPAPARGGPRRLPCPAPARRRCRRRP